MGKQKPRSTFPHGKDCSITFLRRADNKKALVDVYRVTVQGQTFEFHMMKMCYSKGRWVFGSFYKEKKQLWIFRNDVRVQTHAFKGAVYTYVYNGVTYALFTRNRVLHHIVPFVEMLLDPQVDPDSDEYIARHGDPYDEMKDIAQELSFELPVEVQYLLERDEDDIEALE